MSGETTPWIILAAVMVLALAFDLAVWHRKPRLPTQKEAVAAYSVWVILAAAFAVWVLLSSGAGKGLEFVTAYGLEVSLSVDNVFCWLVVLSALSVPKGSWHRVLFYGVLGAPLMRGAFIAGGLAFMHAFHWALYVFGAMVLVAGVRLIFTGERESTPEKSLAYRAARRILPVTRDYAGHRFLVRRGAGWALTPLALALIGVEATDLLFAMDSLPAVLAVSDDPFIVFASNALAIIGLRSLFFVIAGSLGRVRYLRPALAVVLAFVGVKMLLSDLYHLPAAASLMVIGVILGTAVGASYLADHRADHRKTRSPLGTRRSPGSSSLSPVSLEEARDSAPN